MCGIAFIRLRKNIDYFIKKYNDPYFGLNKLYLLMEKQRNRGQDGAGVTVLKFDMSPGVKYMNRLRSIDSDPISAIFNKIYSQNGINKNDNKNTSLTAEEIKKKHPFIGEIMLGHLRYGTHGGLGQNYCHPMIRQNNWKSKNLIIAGNFNMTNNEELFQELIKFGQHPVDKSDMITVLEKFGHFLDEENQHIYNKYKENLSKQDISNWIEKEMNIPKILQRSCRYFDGGYTICGIIGHGASFIIRDPNGIRPGYYYYNDELIVSASERTAIQTVFDVSTSEIIEIQPGNALIINKDAKFKEENILPAMGKKSCSFERIYFARGNDPVIYNERKKLGDLLVPDILKSINYNLRDSVFSYIPNTAEIAFLGMVDSLENYLSEQKKKQILNGNPDNVDLDNILNQRIRIEKIAIKDVKLRTFIASDLHRGDLVSHVYDTTREIITNKDALVIIDDSIVRGTTLENSILKILDRLNPAKIIIVSSAPQIRYPDCYGIDMSKLREFIAFRAAIQLIKEKNKTHILEQCYTNCKKAESERSNNPINFVKDIYAPFTYHDISKQVSIMIKTEGIKAEVEVIYQTIDNLHKACPEHSGDWYFTGDYPTPGGNGVANRAFINYMEGSFARAY